MHNLSHRQVIMFTVPHYLHMREDSQLIQTVTSLAGNSCFGRWQNVSIQIEKSCVYRGMLKALSQITPYAFYLRLRALGSYSRHLLSGA